MLAWFLLAAFNMIEWNEMALRTLIIRPNYDFFSAMRGFFRVDIVEC